jgi:hypothetical protein
MVLVAVVQELLAMEVTLLELLAVLVVLAVVLVVEAR